MPCPSAMVLLLTAANTAGARVASRTTLVLTVLPLAVLVPLVTYLVFDTALNVPLPRGWFR